MPDIPRTPTAASKHLFLIAMLEDLNKSGHFKVTAFKNAADAVLKFSSLEEALKSDASGLGKSTREVLEDFLTTGTSKRIEELGKRFPIEALSMCRVKSVGPVTAMKLHMQGYHNFEMLAEAARAGKLKEDLAVKVIYAAENDERIPRGTAELIMQDLFPKILAIPGIEKAEICGSYRRQRDTVHDVDIVACALESDNPRILAGFCNLGYKLSCGDNRASILAHGFGFELQTDLWLCTQDDWGARILYSTGSKMHNIALRQKSIDRSWKLNEYGLYDSDGNRIAGQTEEEIYQALGMSYLDPKNRES